MATFWNSSAGHRGTGAASFVPSFRRGMRTEAELREIAANALSISALSWTKLCAKMDFEDLRRLDDDLIRPEGNRLTLEGMKWVEAHMTPGDIAQLMVDLNPSDLQHVQVWVEHAERKTAAQMQTQQRGPAPAPSPSNYSRPAPTPPSSNSARPFIPSFRTGRRTEAELREIAANILNIRPVDVCRLYAKLDLKDSQRLHDELLRPEDLNQHIIVTQFKIVPQELVHVMQELDPSELSRLEQVLQKLAAVDVPLTAAQQREKDAYMASIAAQVAALNEEQERKNEMSNMRVRMTNNNIRRMSESAAELGCIGSGYRMVYKNTYDF